MSRVDVKRPDSVTLILWARGKQMAGDETVPDTYAQSYFDSTSLQAGTVADNGATVKKTKYMDITNNTHIFIRVAIETGGSWNAETTELIQNIGKRITVVNGETRETAYIFSKESPSLSRKELRWPTRAHSKLRNLFSAPRGPFQTSK